MSALASSLLGPVVSLNTLLTTTFVPTLPLPLLPCLHALRVSLAYRAIRARSRAASAAKLSEANLKKESWVVDIAGYLVMAWGGSFLTAYLSHSIPLQLLSIKPLVSYVGVHFYLYLLLSLFPLAPGGAAWLDTLLPLVDGATRTAAVAAGVSLARGNPNPLAASSLLFQLLLGTLAACGGGQLAGTLGVFEPQTTGSGGGGGGGGWRFSTPPALKARSLLEAADVLAAFLGAVAYSLFSGAHPAWTPLLAQAHSAGLPLPQSLLSSFSAAPPTLFALSDAEARAATTLVIAAVFAWRALVLHWVPVTPKTEGQRLEIEAQKQRAAAASSSSSSSASPKGKAAKAKGSAVGGGKGANNNK